MNDRNQIEYAFFEKPMASNRCLQADTALNQNCMVRSLGNEVIRRLDSFSKSVPLTQKVEVLDKFSQKLVNSGHKVVTVRSILISGIKGFNRRVSRCQAEGVPLHRSAGQRADKRRKKKMLEIPTGSERQANQKVKPLPSIAKEQPEGMGGRRGTLSQ